MSLFRATTLLGEVFEFDGTTMSETGPSHIYLILRDDPWP